jgi:predicted transcriptional regulator
LRALKAVACENATALAKGAAWLQAVEQDNSFGTVLESSLAILALADCGFDVGAEREQLLRVQQPDGSFGDIESTVWAVAALADSETENATASIEKATAWLARQKPANEKELALLSLALGYAKKPPPPSRVAPALPALLQIALACAAAATLALLFARLSGKILAGKRRDIYEYIRHRPGAHLSAIQRRFELSPGETTYHLRVLEKSEYIVADKWGRYKRFYVNGNGYREMLKGACYKRVISALKNETARRIVHVLLATKSATQKELAERLGVHPSTINWHAKNLSGAGILDARVRGRYVHYRIKEEALVRRALQLVD